MKIENNSDDERYIAELQSQIKKLESAAKKKDKKINKLQDKKDEMYEKFLNTLVNQKVISQ